MFDTFGIKDKVLKGLVLAVGVTFLLMQVYNTNMEIKLNKRRLRGEQV